MEKLPKNWWIRTLRVIVVVIFFIMDPPKTRVSFLAIMRREFCSTGKEVQGLTSERRQMSGCSCSPMCPEQAQAP